MNAMRSICLFAGASIIFGAGLPLQKSESAAQVSSVGATVHRLAPDFSIRDLNGRRADLAAYRGKVVLLNFWATWCAPCRAEIPEFVSLQQKYLNRGFRIFGISLDDERKPVLDFYQKFKMNYPVAVGDAALAEKYGGILGLPVSFLLGCDGRIEAKFDGQVDVHSLEQELGTLLKADACAKE